MAEAFFDTNVVLHLLSEDPAKADRAEALLAAGGVVGVQVLNEATAVARRKLGMAWPEIREVLATVRAVCRVEPLTLATHTHGLVIAERYGFHVYDALIWAAAIGSNCPTLYSQDMQAGQKIEGTTLVDPFDSAGKTAPSA